MIITVKANAPHAEVEQLKKELEHIGLKIVDIQGKTLNIFLVGDTTRFDEARLLAYPWIEKVTRIHEPYKKASRLFHPEDTIVQVGTYFIGGNRPIVLIGGPCSVESKDQIHCIAKEIKNAGGVMLRGGAFKPRSSPYSFQGLREEGLHLLKEAGNAHQLPVVSEITSVSMLEDFIQHVDVIQVGARNMQNYELLKVLGKIDKPILLKRGPSSTVEEWLLSAEYILDGGNPNVILCERGIRTFEKSTRNTLDLSVIPIVKELSHLPIVVDPSHGTGKWNLVEPMSLAAIAAGADGLLVEVHNDPQYAWSDGGQSLKPKNFAHLVSKAKEIARVIGREVAS